MLPRIVDINENGLFIAKHLGFITIKDGEEIKGQVPVEDIGILVISAYGATISKDAMICLAENGAVTILCGKNTAPAAIVIPANQNAESAQRLKWQVNASKPLQKRLWQTIVGKKLENQSMVLRAYGDSRRSAVINGYIKGIQSGDSTNREACAARVYWQTLFGDKFRRDPEGDWPNSILNYGYAILRAAILRAIYSSGLFPAIGIHHDNGRNPFPLADDLMEPFRPLVDHFAKKCVNSGCISVNPDSKKIISQFLWADLVEKQQTTAFPNAIANYVFSLVVSLKEKSNKLEIPNMVLSEDEA